MRNLRQFIIIFATEDCSQPVKMVSKPEERPAAFASYLEDIKILIEEKFHQFRAHSYTKDAEFKGGWSRSSAKNQLSFVVYIDAELSIWFTKYI